MSTDDPARLMRFVLELRAAGVTDVRTLSAMERTDRARFAPAHLASLALDDAALPLPCGQAMTKPSVVGRMIAALDVGPEDHVLEVGAGSGWQTGVLAALAGRVTSIERQTPLWSAARGKLDGLAHVTLHLGDGREGLAVGTPYDRIVLNGAVAAPSAALLLQMADTCLLLAPILDEAGVRLKRFRRGAAAEDLGPVEFAALEEGVAEAP